MDGFKIDVTGAHRVGVRLDEFPDGLYGQLLEEIEGLSVELLAGVQAATPVLTGLLVSQEREHTFADKDKIKGGVFIAGPKGSQAFAKAAALEYGAHGKAQVRAHEMRLDHYWANELSSPERVMVEAYERTVNIAEHAFERGALADMAPEIVARLNAIVEKAVDEANA